MKNLRNLLLTIFIGFLFLQVGIGQDDHRIGVFAGLSYMTTTAGETTASNREFRRGLSAGMNFEMFFSNHFSFVVGANYLEKGVIDIIDLTDTNGNLTGKTSPVRFHYDYLGFPFKVGAKFGGPLDFMFRVGLSPSITTKGTILTYDLDVDGNRVGEDFLKFDIRDRLTILDLVATAEVEINYLKRKDINLFNRAVFHRSINRLQSQATATQTPLKNFGWSFDFGVKYSL